MIYLAVLAGVFIGSVWLELVLRTNVLRRWRRLLLTLCGTSVLFLVWDAYAIEVGHWHFHGLTGWGVAMLPLEEILFFLVVPLASILSLEAVRAVRGWPAGDEG